MLSHGQQHFIYRRQKAVRVEDGHYMLVWPEGLW